MISNSRSTRSATHPRTDDGSYGSTAQAIRNVLEAVYLAEEVGLDFFGFGEHHTRSMPLSSPAALVNASRPHGVTVDGVSTSEIFVAHPRKRSSSVGRREHPPRPDCI
jgi:hypothetical protein